MRQTALHPVSASAGRPWSASHRVPPKVIWQTGLIIALFFAALALTLDWPQFSGDSEDLVVQTVLQIRNGGPRGEVWWIPMLGDQPRAKKPPLPTWIAAAAVTRDTVRDLDSTDPATRESAYHWLAWEVRWPSLIATCGMLIAIAIMANLILGPAHVVPSVLIFATSLMCLRFNRSATTDVHLTLWVLVANAFLAAALFRNRLWLGCLGAGAALGLALMCKGPVALVETILPAAVFLLIQHPKLPSRARPPLAPSRKHFAPIATGTLLMLVIGLPWYISVFLRNPHTASTWLTEIDRRGAAVASHAPWFEYIVLLPNLLPWLPIFLAGLYLSLQQRPRHRPIAFALCLLLVPIIFLSLFPDRKDRYLLPMAGPAALIAAYAAVRMKRAFPPRNAASALLWASHWLLLLLFAVGVPIASPLLMKTPTGAPCCSTVSVTITLILGLAIVIGGMAWQRNARQSFLCSGAALMLLLNAFFMHAWSQSVQGLSEMKPLADRLHAAFPDGRIVYFDPPPDGKPVTLDLDIYLDRPVPVLATWPANDGTVVAVVMLRKPTDPAPQFEGWQTWLDLTSRKHHWYMLTPPPR